MERIYLNARYGYKHHLDKIGGNLWQFYSDERSTGTYRVIGFEGEQNIGPNVNAFDPEGGPFMSVGSTIDNYVIKSISRTGLFELEKIND